MTDDTDPESDEPAGERPDRSEEPTGERPDRSEEPTGERPDRSDEPTGERPDRSEEPTDDAPPGRRAVDYQGDPVEGVPVLRRVPTDTDALVTVETDEATAWCPYEGTADYYALTLEYQPGDHALELMSYRDYLQTYRDEDLGHEEFAKRVYDDLVAALDPDWLRLTVDAPPRYGLETTIRHQTGPMPAGLRETQPTRGSAVADDGCDDG